MGQVVLSKGDKPWKLADLRAKLQSFWKGVIAQTSPKFRSNCSWMDLFLEIAQTSPAVN